MLRSVATVFLVALPALLSSQSDSSARTRAPHCWRGKPEPLCQSFWITELSGEYSYATTQTRYRFDYGTYVNAYSRPDVSSQALLTLGPMFNASPSRALGGTISAGFNNDGSRIAVEARRRYWIAPGGGIDISAGGLRQNVPPPPNEYQRAQYGATAGVSITSGDLLHINAHADLLFTGGRVRAGGTVGGGVGTYGAVGAIVLAGLSAVAVIMLIGRTGGDF